LRLSRLADDLGAAEQVEPGSVCGWPTGPFGKHVGNDMAIRSGHVPRRRFGGQQNGAQRAKPSTVRLNAEVEAYDVEA